LKISILTPNLSANCAGRADVLAQVLRRSHEVEIVGPTFGADVWAPLAGQGIPIKALPVGAAPWQAFRLPRLLDLADGELLYASKPLAASLGVAALARGRRGRPLIVDVDDWELGFARQTLDRLSPLRKLRYLASSTLRPHQNHSWWNNLFSERLIPRADALTVSNSWLKKRFGGSVVWHGRDTGAFRPQAFDGADERRRHGIPAGVPVAMYFGTLRPHKGVEDLIQAVAASDRSDLHLALVGVSDDDYAQQLVAAARAALGDRLIVFGLQPFSRVPQFMVAADVIVIPQRGGDATVGQMPAKLFDAMAMQRPVVSTAVSDIPEALAGCGWVVPPQAPRQLAAAIDEVLDRPEEANRRAAVARERCIERFSWDAMERTLERVLAPFMPASA